MSTIYYIGRCKILDWLANLYYADIGGFYFSNSARNFNGFLPDLESTVQALGFITNSGMAKSYDGSQSYADVIETAINKALIPVSAELGKSNITVMDFANLQVGDIIKLNKSIEDELDVYVGNIVKFKALPGSFSDNYAVKVTEIYREEE